MTGIAATQQKTVVTREGSRQGTADLGRRTDGEAQRARLDAERSTVEAPATLNCLSQMKTQTGAGPREVQLLLLQQRADTSAQTRQLVQLQVMADARAPAPTEGKQPALEAGRLKTWTDAIHHHGSLVQRQEPEAKPLQPAEGYIYHITTLENFQSILSRRGLFPLNWVIEGTNGLTASPESTSRGLDAVRGAGDHETLEAHQEQVDQATMNWNKLPNDEYKQLAGKLVGDIKLGRKRDFVYGARGAGTITRYQRHYVEDAKLNPRDLVILRWVQGREDYYPDLQDDEAIKTLQSIDLSRLEVARGHAVGDSLSEAKEYFSQLAWIRADDQNALKEAELVGAEIREMAQAPVTASREQPAPPEADELTNLSTDEAIAWLEDELAQESADDDELLASIERGIEQDKQDEEDLLQELEKEIAREGEEDDALIRDLEAELGPEVVLSLEREVEEELRSEVQETDRLLGLTHRVIQEAAPLLLQADSMEEQLQIAMEEAQDMIQKLDDISERLARPLN